MQARWGIAWLLAALGLLAMLCAAVPGFAADPWGSTYRLPYLAVSSQSPMETQMLGEKSFQTRPNLSPGPALLPEFAPSLQINKEGGATIRLPRNMEMHISFLYNREPASAESQRLAESPLMMKYAMDYRLLPNLQVGLSSYLYRRAEEGFPFQRAMGNNPLIGYGSELKYDLGNWSFLLKSQMEPNSRDQREGLQNWFRVWYAF